MLRNHDELEARVSAHLWHLGAVGRSSKKGGVPWNISVVASEVVLSKDSRRAVLGSRNRQVAYF